MKNDKRSPLIAETLRGLKKLDDRVYMLDYRFPYALDKLLRRGVKGMAGLTLFAQRHVHTAARLHPLPGGFGCSTFNARTPEGKVLMGRNFDYKDSVCLVVFTSPEGGYRSVSVTTGTFLLYGIRRQRLDRAAEPLRLMGAPYVCMDGLNEAGLAAAILEIKAKATRQSTGRTPITPPVAVRAILDSCATVDEALTLLSAYDMRDLLFTNYHYQLADARGNTAIVEYVGGEMHVIRPESAGGCLALTNFFLTEGGDNRREMGRDRFETIRDTLERGRGEMTEAEAMALLQRCELCYHHKWMPHMVTTVWSAVYNCTERTMELCAGMEHSRLWRFSPTEPGRAVPVINGKGGANAR